MKSEKLENDAQSKWEPEKSGCRKSSRETVMDTDNDKGDYTSERHNTFQYICSQL